MTASSDTGVLGWDAKGSHVSPQGQNERQDFSPMGVARDERLLAALRGREPTALKHLHVVAQAVHDDATDGAEYAGVYAEIQALKDRLQSENIVPREEIDKTSMFEEIVGVSPPLRTVLSHVSKVAPTDSTVLITGETGTGKELVARAIHKRSPRSARAFVAVNCAAIPSSLKMLVMRAKGTTAPPAASTS